ncbi:MAG: M20/M25/M40 family metallo-hydrolase [Candidatus Bathyarchaeota archaeon]|nr:MAG: M20/M25/M40 family metallo-hydrolase [Candidatus Bathyarchaeota archaeon]
MINEMTVQLLKEVEEEVTNFLSELIRINTTNPPGNETKAAKYLAENLLQEGFNCELYESAPERGNLIARLKGTGEKPSLLLLSHLDVVAADAKEWSIDPFSGIVKDGFVWGRGALDMKGMTAIEVMTMKLLKRNNVKLKGDVILAATADEEKGGLAGTDYLLRNYPEKIRADYVLNEGGGGPAIPTQKRNVYTVQTAEKGILWFKVKAKGAPGHASKPNTADNAIMRMNKVIKKLGNYRSHILLVSTVKQFLTEIAREDATLQQCFSRLLANPELSDQILDELAKTAPQLAEEIRPRIRMTITPTMIHGGVKENVIPSECEAVFDCRILPEQTSAEALSLIKDLLKDVDSEKLSFENLQVQEPSESPAETPLYDVITSVLKEFEPNCGTSPMLMTGGTDSRFFRRIGSICYGFHPIHPDVPYGEMVRTVHGVNERISIENLVFGTSVLYEAVRRFMSL